MRTTYSYDDIRGGYDHAAQTAINRSVQHDEIVTLVVSDAFDQRSLVSALQALAEEGQETDSVAASRDVTEVWAWDPASGDQDMIWRVHVRLQAAA